MSSKLSPKELLAYEARSANILKFNSKNHKDSVSSDDSSVHEDSEDGGGNAKDSDGGSGDDEDDNDEVDGVKNSGSQVTTNNYSCMPFPGFMMLNVPLLALYSLRLLERKGGYSVRTIHNCDYLKFIRR